MITQHYTSIFLVKNTRAKIEISLTPFAKAEMFSLLVLLEE